MGQITPKPVNFREYYKAMRTAYIQRKEDAFAEIENLRSQIIELHKNVEFNHNDYLSHGINLSKYPEFINNEYVDGEFLTFAKGAYLNRKNNYKLTSNLFNLVKLAKKQERLYILRKEFDLYDKILSTKFTDYARYVRLFFVEVHKKMILDGCAYHFGQGIGDLIICRVKTTNKRPLIDYQATKKKKAEIIANGGRLYNKEEAKFCEDNGLEYDGQDGRVYLNREYRYELLLAHRHFKDAYDFEYKPQDYISPELRKFTNDTLIEYCNSDLNKICELNVDLKLKLTLCNNVDKTLYTNFIRNETQTSYKYSAIDCKG